MCWTQPFGIFLAVFVCSEVTCISGARSYESLSRLCLKESLQLTTVHEPRHKTPINFTVFVRGDLPAVGFHLSTNRSLHCKHVDSIFLRVNCKDRPSHSQQDYSPFCQFTAKGGACRVVTYNTWVLEPRCWCEKEGTETLAFGVTALLDGQCELDVTLKASGFDDLPLPHWLTFVIKPLRALNPFKKEPSPPTSLSATERTTDVLDIYKSRETNHNVTEIDESATEIDHNVNGIYYSQTAVFINSTEEGAFDNTEHVLYVGVGSGAVSGIGVAICVAIWRGIHRCRRNGQANQRSPTRNDNAELGGSRNNHTYNNDHQVLPSASGTYQEISDIDETIAVAAAPPLPPPRPRGETRGAQPRSRPTIQPPLPCGIRAIPPTTQALESALGSVFNAGSRRSNNQDLKNAVVTTLQTLPRQNGAIQQFAPLPCQTRNKLHNSPALFATSGTDTCHRDVAPSEDGRNGIVAQSPPLLPRRNKAVPKPRLAVQSLATSSFNDDGRNKKYNHQAEVALLTLHCGKKLPTLPHVLCDETAAPQYSMQGFDSSAESPDFDQEDREISLQTLTTGKKSPPELKPPLVSWRGRGTPRHGMQAFSSTRVQSSHGYSNHTDFDHDAERSLQNQTSCRKSCYTLKPKPLPRQNIGIPRGTKDVNHIPRSTQVLESRVDRSKPFLMSDHSSKLSKSTRCPRRTADVQDVPKTPLGKQKRNVSHNGMAKQYLGGMKREMKDETLDSDRSNTEVKQIYSSRKRHHLPQRSTRELPALRWKPAARNPKAVGDELNNEVASPCVEMASPNTEMDSPNDEMAFLTIQMHNSDVDNNIISNNADKKLYENTREFANFSSLKGDERKRSRRVTTVYKRLRKVTRFTDAKLQDVAKWLLDLQESCGGMDASPTDSDPDHGQIIQSQSDEAAGSHIQDRKLQDVSRWVLNHHEGSAIDGWHTDSGGSDTETFRNQSSEGRTRHSEIPDFEDMARDGY